MAHPDYVPADIEFASYPALGLLFEETARGMAGAAAFNEFVNGNRDYYELTLSGRRISRCLSGIGQVLEVGKAIEIEYYPGDPASVNPDLRPSCNFLIAKPAASVFDSEWIQLQRRTDDPAEPWFIRRDPILKPAFQSDDEPEAEDHVSSEAFMYDVGLNRLTLAETAALRGIIANLDLLTTRNVFRYVGRSAKAWPLNP